VSGPNLGHQKAIIITQESEKTQNPEIIKQQISPLTSRYNIKLVHKSALVVIGVLFRYFMTDTSTGMFHIKFIRSPYPVLLNPTVFNRLLSFSWRLDGREQRFVAFLALGSVKK
jgi:hypothetical protein